MRGPFVAVARARTRRRLRAAAPAARGPERWSRWLPASALAREARYLPDLADEVARGLRVGRSALDAIDGAVAAAPAGGALARELTALTAAVRRGMPLGEALDAWSEQSAVDGAGVVGAAFVLALTAGGDPARALEGAAATLRERVMLEREVVALSSQARASALVLAVAPPAFTGLSAMVDPATATFLVGSPLGLACLAVGLGLDLAGWRWMARITRSVR